MTIALSTLQSILTFLAFLALVLLVGAVWVWRLKRRYSRDRFAFFAWSSLTAIGLLFLAQIGLGFGLLDVVLLVARDLFKLNVQIEDYRPGALEYVVGLVVYVVLCLTASSIHRNWGGDRWSGREQVVDTTDVLEKDEAGSLGHSGVTEAAYKAIRPAEGASREWRTQARQLLTLARPDLTFDNTEGWHAEESTWIGRHRRTGEVVAVLCHLSLPGATQIAGWRSYVTEIYPTVPIELIVAIRQNANQTKPPPGVEVVTEEALLDDLVDFSDYIYEIRRRVETDKLGDSNLTYEDLYVPSDFRVGTSENRTRDVERYLLKWTREKGQRQLAVLGDYGQGKSTLALMLTYRLLMSEKSERIPLLVELRGTSPRNLRPLEVLAIWASPYGIDPNAIMALVHAGKVVLIFEGFDEMDLIGSAAARLDHFRTLWRLCTPNGKLVFTGRPNFFFDNHELKRALGIGEVGNGPSTTAITLEPFSITQIGKALRGLHKSRRSAIVGLARADPNFLEIASRPALLFLVGRIWDEIEQLGLQNVNSASIIRHFVAHSYRRQTEKLAEGGQFMLLNESERSFCMDCVACFMAASNLPNQISREELQTIARKVALDMPVKVSEYTGSAKVKEKTQSLATRLAGFEDPAENVLADIHSTGLLVVDPSRNGVFKFAHKSFMEFLIAKVAAESLGTEDEQGRAISVFQVSHMRLHAIRQIAQARAFFLEILQEKQASEGGGVNPREFVSSLFDLIVLQLHEGRLRGLVVYRLTMLDLANHALRIGDKAGELSDRLLYHWQVRQLAGGEYHPTPSVVASLRSGLAASSKASSWVVRPLVNTLAFLALNKHWGRRRDMVFEMRDALLLWYACCAMRPSYEVELRGMLPEKAYRGLRDLALLERVLASRLTLESKPELRSVWRSLQRSTLVKRK